jgi:transcriptional regulator with XRE-family HTH domain
MGITAIGERIRGQREKRRLTQAEVANALQLTAQAVSKWERGENAPDLLTLVNLARLLGVSTDWLLGAHTPERDVCEATVLVADLIGTAQKAEELGLRDVLKWMNGRFYQLTEAVLEYDAVPMPCDGDAFICFFAGADHRDRAVRAARYAHAMLTDAVGIGLADGEVHLVMSGHPEHAQRQLVGTPLFHARCASDWAKQHTHSQVAATSSLLAALAEPIATAQTAQVPLPHGAGELALSEVGWEPVRAGRNSAADPGEGREVRR